MNPANAELVLPAILYEGFSIKGLTAASGQAVLFRKTGR